MIIEKVDDKAALINLNQSKVFYRVKYHFLEIVLSTAWFEPNIRRWIRLLNESLES